MTSSAPTHLSAPHFTSFDGPRRLASGSLLHNALAVKVALVTGAAGPLLIFDDSTGKTIDVDLRGSDQDLATRLAPAPPPVAEPLPDDTADPDAPRGRGRPKLGVVAREVTLLPRHWDWLAGQPGGASVALRKLVEAARRHSAGQDQTRRAQERTYHFMSTMAGNLAGFEEASRALFAGDLPRWRSLMAGWPADVQAHLLWLAQVQG